MNRPSRASLSARVSNPDTADISRKKSLSLQQQESVARLSKPRNSQDDNAIFADHSYRASKDSKSNAVAEALIEELQRNAIRARASDPAVKRTSKKSSSATESVIRNLLEKKASKESTALASKPRDASNYSERTTLPQIHHKKSRENETARRVTEPERTYSRSQRPDLQKDNTGLSNQTRVQKSPISRKTPDTGTRPTGSLAQQKQLAQETEQQKRYKNGETVQPRPSIQKKNSKTKAMEVSPKAKDVNQPQSLTQFYDEAQKILAALPSEDDVSLGSDNSQKTYVAKRSSPAASSHRPSAGIRPGFQRQYSEPENFQKQQYSVYNEANNDHRGTKRPSSLQREPKVRQHSGLPENVYIKPECYRVPEEEQAERSKYFGIIFNCLNESRAANFAQNPIVKHYLRKRTYLDHECTVKVPLREFMEWKQELHNLENELYKSIHKQKNLDFMFADVMGTINELTDVDDEFLDELNESGEQYADIHEEVLVRLLQKHEWLLTLRDDFQDYLRIMHKRNVQMAEDIRAREQHRQRQGDFDTAEVKRAQTDGKRFERLMAYQTEQARNADKDKKRQRQQMVEKAAARHDQYARQQRRSSAAGRQSLTNRYDNINGPFRHDSRELSPQVAAVLSELLPAPRSSQASSLLMRSPVRSEQMILPWTPSPTEKALKVTSTESSVPPRPPARLSTHHPDEVVPPGSSTIEWGDEYEIEDDHLREAPSVLDVPSYVSEYTDQDASEQESSIPPCMYLKSVDGLTDVPRCVSQFGDYPIERGVSANQDGTRAVLVEDAGTSTHDLHENTPVILRKTVSTLPKAPSRRISSRHLTTPQRSGIATQHSAINIAHTGTQPSTARTASPVHASVQPSTTSAVKLAHVGIQPSTSSSSSLVHAAVQPSAASAVKMTHAGIQPSSIIMPSLVHAGVQQSAASAANLAHAGVQPSSTGSSSLIHVGVQPSTSSRTLAHTGVQHSSVSTPTLTHAGIQPSAASTARVAHAGIQSSSVNVPNLAHAGVQPSTVSATQVTHAEVQPSENNMPKYAHMGVQPSGINALHATTQHSTAQIHRVPSQRSTKAPSPTVSRQFVGVQPSGVNASHAGTQHSATEIPRVPSQRSMKTPSPAVSRQHVGIQQSAATISHAGTHRSQSDVVHMDTQTQASHGRLAFSPTAKAHLEAQPSDRFTDTLSPHFPSRHADSGTQHSSTDFVRPLPQASMGTQPSLQSLSRDDIADSNRSERMHAAVQPSATDMYHLGTQGSRTDLSHTGSPRSKVDTAHVGAQRSGIPIGQNAMQTSQMLSPQAYPSQGMYKSPSTEQFTDLTRLTPSRSREPMSKPSSQNDMAPFRPAPLSMFLPHSDANVNNLSTRADLATSRSGLGITKSVSEGYIPSVQQTIDGKKYILIPAKHRMVDIGTFLSAQLSAQDLAYSPHDASTQTEVTLSNSKVIISQRELDMLRRTIQPVHQMPSARSVGVSPSRSPLISPQQSKERLVPEQGISLTLPDTKTSKQNLSAKSLQEPPEPDITPRFASPIRETRSDRELAPTEKLSDVPSQELQPHVLEDVFGLHITGGCRVLGFGEPLQSNLTVCPSEAPASVTDNRPGPDAFSSNVSLTNVPFRAEPLSMFMANEDHVGEDIATRAEQVLGKSRSEVAFQEQITPALIQDSAEIVESLSRTAEAEVDEMSKTQSTPIVPAVSVEDARSAVTPKPSSNVSLVHMRADPLSMFEPHDEHEGVMTRAENAIDKSRSAVSVGGAHLKPSRSATPDHRQEEMAASSTAARIGISDTMLSAVDMVEKISNAAAEETEDPELHGELPELQDTAEDVVRALFKISKSNADLTESKLQTGNESLDGLPMAYENTLAVASVYSLPDFAKHHDSAQEMSTLQVTRTKGVSSEAEMENIRNESPNAQKHVFGEKDTSQLKTEFSRPASPVSIEKTSGGHVPPAKSRTLLVPSKSAISSSDSTAMLGEEIIGDVLSGVPSRHDDLNIQPGMTGASQSTPDLRLGAPASVERLAPPNIQPPKSRSLLVPSMSAIASSDSTAMLGEEIITDVLSGVPSHHEDLNVQPETFAATRSASDLHPETPKTATSMERLSPMQVQPAVSRTLLVPSKSAISSSDSTAMLGEEIISDVLSGVPSHHEGINIQPSKSGITRSASDLLVDTPKSATSMERPSPLNIQPAKSRALLAPSKSAISSSDSAAMLGEDIVRDVLSGVPSHHSESNIQPSTISAVRSASQLRVGMPENSPSTAESSIRLGNVIVDDVVENASDAADGLPLPNAGSHISVAKLSPSTSTVSPTPRRSPSPRQTRSEEISGNPESEFSNTSAHNFNQPGALPSGSRAPEIPVSELHPHPMSGLYTSDMNLGTGELLSGSPFFTKASPSGSNHSMWRPPSQMSIESSKSSPEIAGAYTEEHSTHEDRAQDLDSIRTVKSALSVIPPSSSRSASREGMHDHGISPSHLAIPHSIEPSASNLSVWKPPSQLSLASSRSGISERSESSENLGDNVPVQPSFAPERVPSQSPSHEPVPGDMHWNQIPPEQRSGALSEYLPKSQVMQPDTSHYSLFDIPSQLSVNESVESMSQLITARKHEPSASNVGKPEPSGNEKDMKEHVLPSTMLPPPQPLQAESNYSLLEIPSQMSMEDVHSNTMIAPSKSTRLVQPERSPYDHVPQEHPPIAQLPSSHSELDMYNIPSQLSMEPSKASHDFIPERSISEGINVGHSNSKSSYDERLSERSRVEDPNALKMPTISREDFRPTDASSRQNPGTDQPMVRDVAAEESVYSVFEIPSQVSVREIHNEKSAEALRPDHSEQRDQSVPVHENMPHRTKSDISAKMVAHGSGISIKPAAGPEPRQTELERLVPGSYSELEMHHIPSQLSIASSTVSENNPFAARSVSPEFRRTDPESPGTAGSDIRFEKPHASYDMDTFSPPNPQSSASSFNLTRAESRAAKIAGSPSDTDVKADSTEADDSSNKMQASPSESTETSSESSHFDHDDKQHLDRYIASHDSKKLRRDSGSVREHILSPRLVKDTSSMDVGRSIRTKDTHEDLPHSGMGGKSSTHMHVHSGRSEDDLYRKENLRALQDSYRDKEYVHTPSDDARSLETKPSPSMEMVSTESPYPSTDNSRASSPSGKTGDTDNQPPKPAADHLPSRVSSETDYTSSPEDSNKANMSQYGSSSAASLTTTEKPLDNPTSAPASSRPASAHSTASMSNKDRQKDLPSPSSSFTSSTSSVDILQMEKHAALVASATSEAPEKTASTHESTQAARAEEEHLQQQTDIHIEVIPAESGSERVNVEIRKQDRNLLSATKKPSHHSSKGGSRSTSAGSSASSESGTPTTASRYATSEAPSAVRGSESDVSQVSVSSSPPESTGSSGSNQAPNDLEKLYTTSQQNEVAEQKASKEYGGPGTKPLAAESENVSVYVSIQDVHTSPLSLHVISKQEDDKGGTGVGHVTVVSDAQPDRVNVTIEEHHESGSSDPSERSPSDTESNVSTQGSDQKHSSE